MNELKSTIKDLWYKIGWKFVKNYFRLTRLFEMEIPNEEYRPLFGGEVTDRPLFGVSNRRDRLVNLFFVIVTVLIFIVTLISAFVAQVPPRGLNVYFAICIFLICLSHVVLIYWYRQGDLDPKFRLMIYYNAFTIILLSMCALSYFFVDRKLTL